MIGWVTKRAVFEHLHKRIIQTANNNCGYVADAGVIISDLADRLQVWLNEMDIVDAVPVVHGKWTTKRTQKHDGEWYCTICDYEPIVMSDDMKYCPGCGAKMDLEGTA